MPFQLRWLGQLRGGNCNDGDENSSDTSLSSSSSDDDTTDSTTTPEYTSSYYPDLDDTVLHAEPSALADLGPSRLPPAPCRLCGVYPVHACSIRGGRPYMEDELLVVVPDVAAVFDGHGGKAVSRYVRQNLYAELQAALPRVLLQRQEQLEQSTVCDNNHHPSLLHPILRL
jgi:hypothetical protein